MGTRGPVPKRSDQRIRRNGADVPPESVTEVVTQRVILRCFQKLTILIRQSAQVDSAPGRSQDSVTGRARLNPDNQSQTS